jgi:2-dehydropantoate 2-reductase
MNTALVRGAQRRAPVLASEYRFKSASSLQLQGGIPIGGVGCRCYFPATMTSNSGRIHILGVGNLARLFAHSLSKSPRPPPITLLFHRQSLLEEWEKAGRKIEITTNGVVSTSSNYEVEVVEELAGHQDIIETLIVTTKTIAIANAISSVRHRLTSNSTILFTQNGMGSIEEVTSSIFPNPSKRPHYLTAITSHGVYSTSPFRSVHAGLAHITIGRPQTQTRQSSKSQYLLDLIVAAPSLAAKEVSPEELTRLQLEKLVINAMINPLTVIFNCQNGELFTRGPIVRVMRLLLSEASQVILSLPELRDDPTTESSFSKESLEEVVLDVAAKTAKNTSSMLQDVRAERATEIDYINGYIVKRGRELGVDVRLNKRLVDMVKEKRVIGVDDTEDDFPPYGLERSWAGDVLSVLI